MKFVIYKELGNFKTTTEENYNRRIQNAREICTWNDNFKTAEEIIDFVIKHFNPKYKKEDFIII